MDSYTASRQYLLQLLRKTFKVDQVYQVRPLPTINYLSYLLYILYMAPPKVLVLGHSAFVRRLKSDLHVQQDARMSSTFKLNATAQVYMHGIGGRTVRKVRNHDLGVVARLSPDIVMREIGTNDLSLLPPEVVGSRGGSSS